MNVISLWTMIIILSVAVIAEFIMLWHTDKEWYKSNLETIDIYTQLLQDFIEEERKSYLKLNDDWYERLIDILHREETNQDDMESND